MAKAGGRRRNKAKPNKPDQPSSNLNNMSGEIFKFNCLIAGKNLDSVFAVQISKSLPVWRLKDVIISVNADLRVDNLTAARNLRLEKVSKMQGH